MDRSNIGIPTFWPGFSLLFVWLSELVPYRKIENRMGCVVACLLCPLAAMAFTPSAVDGGFSAPAARRGFLNQYCGACHNDRLKSGGVTLQELDVVDASRSPELAEKVITKLRSGLMPPPGLPRPATANRLAFAAALEEQIDRAAALRPYAGMPALHRLNRTEYANSVRDLLDLQVDVAALLPPDDLSHGFDNMSEVLTISPALMEAYLRAASKVSRMALGDMETPPVTTTYFVPRTTSQAGHVEGSPLGTRGGIAIVHNFPADGEYKLNLRMFHHPVGPLFGINQGLSEKIEIAVNKKQVALLDISPDISIDGIDTPTIRIAAGPQLVSASFLQRFDGPAEEEIQLAGQTLVDLTFGAFPGVTTLPHLRQMSIAGPWHITGISETPSRRKILTCRAAAATTSNAADEECAGRIIAALGAQAFRRPIMDSDMRALMQFYRSGRESGGFEAGIRTALQAILASPEFVFRFEETPSHAPAGRNYPVTDLELASRLSFFLWSSLPDSRLVELAARSQLRQPAVLAGEVRRMLADPRSASLATSFASQWLRLADLRDANPDPYFYPNFDKTLAQSMMRETEFLFESVMREDRNPLDLLTADYTYLNERLARHYGIPDVSGERFRRVTIADPNRTGLLGQGSILLLTSTANRTSPVKRGKYVMEVLLGTPPPPPPPNVPALPEDTQARTASVAKVVSVRERMEQHRANPNCAGCHKLMDPIGFALESFDGIGAQRSKDSGFAIDSSGQMFDGSPLDGPASLRRAVLGHSDLFLRNFTRNLLSYALGRTLNYRDMPAVRAIDRAAAQSGYRFSSLILEIVRSVPFRMRTVEDAEPKLTGAAAIRAAL